MTCSHRITCLASPCVWLLATWLCAGSALAAPFTIYVSPSGDDRWSGGQADPDSSHSDGPLATLPHALEVSRATRASVPGTETTIILRGGKYHLSEPLMFAPEDSGLVLAAYGTETPVISGEAQITGWRPAPYRTPDLWQATAYAGRGGPWIFHELFINGRRAQRARLPSSGFYHIVSGVKGHPLQFQYPPGDIRPEWAAAGDVEMIRLQAWAQTRNQIQAINGASNLVTLAGSVLEYANEANARFYIENAPGPLQPGEWRLDSKTDVVTYRGKPGENVPHDRFTAPRLYELARLEGREGHPVHDIAFRGLAFADSDWRLEGGSDVDVQAGVEVPAAIQARFAQHCTFSKCAFTRLGGYALDLGHGCQSNSILGCDLFDLGGGGVRVGDTDAGSAAAAPNFGNVISDNHIHNIGRVNAPAVGVLVFLSASNLVAHNEIDHSFYTAISVGWTWGYAPNPCRGNIIEFNHLHDIGQGMLSDMGGVYTLGVQPGTMVRQNVIHDVNISVYGGWGLYTDEGSSGIVLESNIVYNCQSAGMHQHYGETNLFYNNIFALNRNAQLARTRVEPHLSFAFTNNIVYFSSGKLMDGNWSGQGVDLDHNLYFDTRSGPAHPPLDGTVKFEEWQRSGHDTHSVFEDPLFTDPINGDFRLRSNSPAIPFGFHPLDASEAGVRPAYFRVLDGPIP